MLACRPTDRSPASLRRALETRPSWRGLALVWRHGRGALSLHGRRCEQARDASRAAAPPQHAAAAAARPRAAPQTLSKRHRAGVGQHTTPQPSPCHPTEGLLRYLTVPWDRTLHGNKRRLQDSAHDTHTCHQALLPHVQTRLGLTCHRAAQAQLHGRLWIATSVQWEISITNSNKMELLIWFSFITDVLRIFTFFPSLPPHDQTRPNM